MSQAPNDVIEAEVERMRRRNVKLLALLPARQQEHFLEILRQQLRHNPIFSRLLQQVHADAYEVPDVSGDNPTNGPAVSPDVSPEAKRGAR